MGAIDANLPRPELEYFGELLWNLGTEATVKEPAEIKLQLKRKAADILARYDCAEVPQKFPEILKFWSGEVCIDRPRPVIPHGEDLE